jgi:protein-tyrosine phosphatase
MSVKYSVTFLLLAAAFILAGVAAWEVVGWGSAAFVYAAFSFLLLTVAYAGAGSGMFLKRGDGRRYPLAWLLFAPYFGLNALSFWLYRRSHRGPAYASVAPNLFFGRRLTTREAAEAKSLGWCAVLDLAAEFAEVEPLRRVPRYRSLPLLDATAPTEDQLRGAVAWLRESMQSGPVYVHCALGHGRTATVLLAYLLTAGRVSTIRDGLKLLRSLRAGAGLHRGQARLLREFEPRPESVDSH